MQIRRATADDVRQLCITVVEAFADDPVMRWLYPDDDAYFAPGGAVMRPAMENWVRYNEVWCTDDCAAAAVWIQPGRPGAPDDGTERDIDPDLADRFSIIGPLMDAHTPAEPHWYLQLLATHPHWQRNGLGAALMAHRFDIADRDGLACHLETETVVNVAYYRRHGFDVSSEFDIPAGRHQHRFSSFGADPATEVGPHMWAMLRSAR